MTMAEQLAAFAAGASYDRMSEVARGQGKLLLFDALGCAIGSLGAEPIGYLRTHTEEFGGAGLATLIGGGKTAPDRAAFYNTCLIRYLDFNDSYMGKTGTVHPSDNTGAVLAAAEYAGASGRDFIAALALAYQVQCRLSDAARSESRGFDQGTHGAYGSAAGAARALGLDAKRIAKRLVKSLDQQDRLIVALYYYENLTLREIGEILDVSESRVCQIHTKVVTRLRAHLMRKAGHLTLEA